MWLQFSITFGLIVCILFLPGFFLLRSVNLPSSLSICLAPAMTTGVISGLAILYGYLGVPSNIYSLLLPMLILAFGIYLIKKAVWPHSCCSNKMDKSNLILLLYIIIGVFAVTFLFIKNLDGADSTFQAFDDWMHYGRVRTFLNTSNYSSLTSIYSQNDINPFIASSAFYPSAWHALAALAVDITGASIPLVVNALNSVLISLVFTSGIYCLIDKITQSQFGVLIAAAFISVGVASCPWDFLTFGPLYPNLLSLSLVPSTAVVFIELIESFVDRSWRKVTLYFFIFIVALVSLALAQPNGIFTLAVLLAPYLVYRARLYACLRFRDDDRKRIAIPIATCIVILLIWTFCYRLPALQSVVQFNWAATDVPSQAVIDVVLFGMVSKPIQPILTFLVIYGLFIAFNNQEIRWVAFPYLFSTLAYVVCISTEGFLKHYLTGFWYTDPHRIAALVGLFSIPLLSIGFNKVIENMLDRSKMRLNATRSFMGFVAAGCGLVLIVLVAYPNININGVGYVETAFGRFRTDVFSQNEVSGTKVLTKKELEFSEKALAMIPDNSIVINSPNDGSGFLYALQNARVLYREFALPSIENEKTESEIIRHGLNRVATDESVKNAVDTFGAQYLLVLDLGGEGDEDSEYFWSYWPDQWDGIDAVNDNTPGFTVLLSEGDMRLYKID